MKKVFSLLVICLLLTSCGKKEVNNQQQNQEQTPVQENQEQQNQTQGNGEDSNAPRTSQFVMKVNDETSIYTYDSNITYKGSNLNDLLNNGTTIEEVVDGMAFTTNEDTVSNMYIMENDPEFFVMFCGTDSNKNIYISSEFEEAYNSCK